MKWSDVTNWDGSTETFCMKFVLERTMSKMFPLMCVGQSTIVD